MRNFFFFRGIKSLILPPFYILPIIFNNMYNIIELICRSVPMLISPTNRTSNELNVYGTPKRR